MFELLWNCVGSIRIEAFESQLWGVPAGGPMSPGV